ncbi:MAG: diol dehydratase small subunit, partial [Anaerolineae bacterium]|nr:diol dehydratase small subunit [Anaerolineae bacterium]
MSQQELISAIVREVLSELSNGQKVATQPPSTNGHKLNYRDDYPLADKHADLVKTATGKSLGEITLDAVVNGQIKGEEIRIAPETLELQAQIAESIDRPQLASSFRRAAEMIAIPDARLL